MIALDDNIEEHPKFISLSDSAFSLWVRCLGYCRRNLTDGFVPERAAVTKSRARKPAGPIGELLAVAPGCTNPLWHKVEGGYQFHDYLEWNPSAADVQAKIEANREKGRRGGMRSGQVRAEAKQEQASGLNQQRSQNEAAGFDSGSTKTNPDPIRSDPIRSDPKEMESAQAEPAAPTPRARGSRCPSSVDPKAPQWLADHGIPALDDPGSGGEVAKMLDHFAAKAGATATKLDWAATWRTWARKAAEWAKPGTAARPPWKPPVQPISDAWAPNTGVYEDLPEGHPDRF